MKKVLVFCLTLVMIATMCVGTLAKPNGIFVKSPSKNKAPTIQNVEKEDEDCSATFVITPFADRENLPTDKREILENFYEAISGIDKDDEKVSENVKTVRKKIKELIKQIAKDKKIKEKDIAVSDLFDISQYGCDTHNDHNSATVKLKSDTFKHFVALLQYENGEWKIVENVTLNKDGTITIKGNVVGTYAVLVDSSKLPSDTGDNSNIALWVMLLSASALAIVLVALNKKKA